MFITDPIGIFDLELFSLISFVFSIILNMVIFYHIGYFFTWLIDKKISLGLNS